MTEVKGKKRGKRAFEEKGEVGGSDRSIDKVGGGSETLKHGGTQTWQTQQQHLAAQHSTKQHSTAQHSTAGQIRDAYYM
eukprot:CAMPEP_0206458250 /NCGR_PEP_ID=MMETSP0324_2-20121206/23453_1 /ASSEMBLY_ACC=CAM_ASM_000836 /TAXON_ID=2866 /ORGANISM="Crypthecodinium cohnii, Strain Seligo" /LENGTH=78 /DNA_ID=CAMNT_0053929543 /DNA_START=120 /DNA_END=357 /DNA_ORIENTATION=-